MPFKIVRNDLTRVKADAIVNTANPMPICASGTDLAIYEAAGKDIKIIYVNEEHKQRDYFSFYDYSYKLDVTKQKELMPYTKPLIEGLKESYE